MFRWEVRSKLLLFTAVNRKFVREIARGIAWSSYDSTKVPTVLRASRSDLDGTECPKVGVIVRV